MSVPPPPDHDAEADAQAVSPVNVRILIVDDDRLMRDMLPTALARGYAPGASPLIEAVGTPQEALGRLAPQQEGERLVILCDYNLKTVQNGLDVLAEAKRERPDAVRILFSGHARDEIRGVDDAEIDGFLEKPFRLQEIVSPFRAIVERAIVERTTVALEESQHASAREEDSLASAARRLGHDEIASNLAKAALKGERARARALAEEVQRRGQRGEAPVGPFSGLDPHDHACVVFEEPEDLRDALARFTEEGIAREEATVFIHSFASKAEALAFLESGRLDFQSLLGSEFFLIAPYREAFEGGAGRIDFYHVEETLVGIMGKAKRGGRAGVRIFADASRAYLREGREREWFDFETWLGIRLRQSVRLVCAYARPDVEAPERRAAVLRTHLYELEVRTREPGSRDHVGDVVAWVVPAVRGRLAQQGSDLKLDLAASGNALPEHFAPALAALLLVLPRHAIPGQPFILRTRDLAGGDTEIVVEGIQLPDDFPEGSPFEPLLKIAAGLLTGFHRARLASGQGGLRFLVPGKERPEGVPHGEGR